MLWTTVFPFGEVEGATGWRGSVSQLRTQEGEEVGTWEYYSGDLEEEAKAVLEK